MQCHRCKSEMYVERFQDLQATGDPTFTGWKCLICGEIFDSVIFSNRTLHPAPLVGKNRKLIIASKR
ncbi:MAG: hypothetical protein ACHQYP_11905 [Nitrospiria bacterium]